MKVHLGQLERNRLKKRFKKFALSVVAAGLTALFTPFAALANTAVISADGVNVRQEASTSSNVLTQYDTGESIDIISYENGWFKINEPKSQSGFAYVTSEYVNLVQVDATVIEDRVNIRDGSSTERSVLGVLNKGDKISVTGSEGDFYLFDMNGSVGYIYKSFVDGGFLASVQEQEAVEVIKVQTAAKAENPVARYGLVTSQQGVNFRSSPSQDSSVIFALPYGDAVDVSDFNDGWYKVTYSGVEGYIIGDYLSVHEGAKPNVSARSQQANAVINFARKFIGTPYVWGGTNLNKGVDCSGFVYSVFRNFGISLSRSSRDQYHNGTRISKSDLATGDLVFFDTNLAGTVSHVGIYIGDGQFIHSCSGSRIMAVTISSIWEDYYSRRYYGASRIIY